MNFFTIKEGQWFAEDVPLQAIAEEIGTPCYVYSKAAICANWKAFDSAFDVHLGDGHSRYSHQINYAVKANSNLAVLNTLAELGSGFDIVSGGELERVLKTKTTPDKIIFSGVGKTKDELSLALKVGVGCINIESESELLRLNSLAIEQHKKANIAIRVNPDVDPLSHPYISTGLKENKFGVHFSAAKKLYEEAAQLPGICIQGIACHIGSQIVSMEPFLQTLSKMLDFVETLQTTGITIQHLNLGGGLGVRYQNENPPDPHTYVKALLSKLKNHPKLHCTIHLEPGRAIVANAGVLLTRVEYIKPSSESHKNFAIVDAAMNDLLRPALYSAWQDIVAVCSPTNPESSKSSLYDIVGPVCETADFIGKERTLPNLNPKDILAVLSAGAYGFSMSSNYNSRPRAAEVMVDGSRFYVVRKRETLEDLFKLETII